MFIQELATIINNVKISDKYYKMQLQVSFSDKCIPGQFIYIKVLDNLVPLLRRPMSIHNSGKKQIEILYEVVGKGTYILSQKKKGEFLDIIGPLGNGFGYKDDFEKAIIISGGIGLSPLFFLAKFLTTKFKKEVVVLLGFKDNSLICFKDKFEKFCNKIKISTEDGSFGYKGVITSLLHHEFCDKCKIFTCGPIPMLKEIAKIGRNYNIEALLEEKMGCGIGMCFGCVCKIKVKNSYDYKRVCTDGPVFDLKKVIWE